MSNKRIELAIPAPCQQRWQDMKPENAGRFCDSCQKTVVDFTAMNDRQIGAYFSNQPKNVCGRFAASQLDRDVVLSQSASNGALKQRWFGLMAAGLLSWSSTQGQSSTQLSDKNVLISRRVAPELPAKGDRIEHQQIAKDSTWVIEGKVIAETDKEPLPGATIVLNETQQTIMADANGLFKLTLPYDQSNKLTLRVGSIGYVTQAITINSAQKLSLVISLAEDSAMLGQIVTVGEVVCVRKPNFFKRLKNRFRASH